MQDNKNETPIKRIRSNPKIKAGRKPRYNINGEEKLLVDERVNQVAIMLAKGISQKNIKIELSREWNCTEQNVHYYLKKAFKALSCSIEKKVDYLLAVQRELWEYILSNAIENGKWGEAQKIIDTMNRMWGLYEDKKRIKVESPVIQFEFGNMENNNNTDDGEDVDMNE